MQEIHDEIEKCKNNAMQDALKMGLIEPSGEKKFDFSCKINPYIEMSAVRKKRKNKSKVIVIHQPERMIELKNIQWKDFSDKFENKCVEENSPFVEVYRSTSKRIVVRKTSFCWVLRNDYAKISSDRLERVKSNARTKKRKNACLYNPVKKFKKKNSKKCTQNAA